MNLMQKFKTPILTLTMLLYFFYKGHPFHYTSYLLLLLSPFIHSFSSQVFITRRDFITFSPTFTQGFIMDFFVLSTSFSFYFWSKSFHNTFTLLIELHTS